MSLGKRKCWLYEGLGNVVPGKAQGWGCYLNISTNLCRVKGSFVNMSLTKRHVRPIPVGEENTVF